MAYTARPRIVYMPLRIVNTELSRLAGLFYAKAGGLDFDPPVKFPIYFDVTASDISMT